MDERKILDGVLEVMQAAESVEADLGPSEYAWLMLMIINHCTMRLANRVGTVLEV